MLDDPNFDHSVIYMVEHHDEGALGLVLNRPSGEELVDPLDGWVSAQSAPSRVFSGGPVEPDALIALARTENRVAAGSADDDDASYLAPLTGDIASADLAADPALVIGRISALRVFRGYAGWEAGQLEAEIESGSWIVLDSDPADVFTAEPTSSGGACCAASPAASAGSPTPPTTSPGTDASRHWSSRRTGASSGAQRGAELLGGRADRATTAAVSASVSVRSGACRRSR